MKSLKSTELKLYGQTRAFSYSCLTSLKMHIELRKDWYVYVLMARWTGIGTWIRFTPFNLDSVLFRINLQIKIDFAISISPRDSQRLSFGFFMLCNYEFWCLYISNFHSLPSLEHSYVHILLISTSAVSCLTAMTAHWNIKLKWERLVILIIPFFLIPFGMIPNSERNQHLLDGRKFLNSHKYNNMETGDSNKFRSINTECFQST